MNYHCHIMSLWRCSSSFLLFLFIPSYRFFCFFSVYPLIQCLVGGLEHFLFSHILGMSSSQLTDHIFQRGGYTTTNQMFMADDFSFFWGGVFGEHSESQSIDGASEDDLSLKRRCMSMCMLLLQSHDIGWMAQETYEFHVLTLDDPCT